MAAIKTKESLSKAIRSERRRLEKNLARVPLASYNVPGVCGAWSIKDLLAHLAAWEQSFCRWYEQRAVMQEIPPEVKTMAAIHRYNQHLYELYHDWQLEDVLRFFHQSYGQIRAVVEQIPEQDLFSPGWYAWTGRWTLEQFVTANTSNHYLWAKNLVIRWQKGNPTLESQIK